MTIPEFIQRCDAYLEMTGRSRVWLSKRLFEDTYRLDHLAGGASDVGVKRLAKALDDLGVLERQHAQDAAKPEHGAAA